MSPLRSTVPAAAILLLFLLSGATSLVYEVLWLRQLVLIFGSTQFATSAVLSTFMGGLALGAFVAGRLAGRRARPLRTYGLLEAGIGVYALAVPFLFDALTPVYRALWDAGASQHFVVLSLAKFVGIAVVLLPPTVLMGATLPVLSRQIADDPDRIGGKVGRLYAVNTFGAVAGTFVAGFVAIPGIGMQRTLWCTAAVNGVLALTAFLLSRRARSVEAVPAAAPAAAPAAPGEAARTPARLRLLLLVFALSGFGALVLEVAWTRVLALVMGSSVYAFSLMLLAFLVGLASGSAYFSRLLRTRPRTDPAALLSALLVSAGLLTYATAFAFGLLPRLFAEIYFAFSPGPNGWFVAHFCFGLLIMFPATFVLGGVFPAVLQMHARGLETVSASVGAVYASNTVGTILGAAAAGFLLIPRLGVLPTVLGVAGLQVVLGVAVVGFLVAAASLRSRALRVLMLALPLLLVVLVPPGWDVRLMNSGVYMNLFDSEWPNGWEDFAKLVYEDNEVVFASEGLTATVFVADQTRWDNRYLSVNGKVEASTHSNLDLETQLMCSHLPLLLHEDPRDVLVIGLASGITAGAAATHPVSSIRVVEVEKEMVPAARLFAEHNNRVLDDPRVELSINDARNDLEFSSRTYDVIISEPSNPWMTVAANLFTEDFFRMARARVREGGIFSQWIQNYYLPAEDLRSIIAAFRSAFPQVLLFETYGGSDLLLLGSQERIRLDLPRIERRMAELRVWVDLARVEVRRPEDVLLLFRLGTDEVERLIAGAPRNTDDNARVEFSAPKTLGAPTVTTNLELLGRFRADPLDYVGQPPAPGEERDRLRLDLAEGWLLRGREELAREAAQRAVGGPLGPRAERILARIDPADPGT